MVQVADELQQGRESYAKWLWSDAYASLSNAARAAELAGEDLELLATAAAMLGREEERIGLLERAHHAYVAAGERLAAIRSAFWVGVTAMRGGDTGRATGWLGRAQRMLDQEGQECVERGYLLVPTMFAREAAGDYDEAGAVATRITEIGQRFGDRDLFALAVHEHGHILIRQGRVAEGLALLDEAMVAVTCGELSPIPTGLVYCGVILACQEVYEVRRAQEWTRALARWCQQQTDLVAFSGTCHVHRAELLQFTGEWEEGLQEASRARLRCAAGRNAGAIGEACYRQGELHRVRGELDAAQKAYTEASRHGREPQPGLAMLRLIQGDRSAAFAAIQRVLGEAAEPLSRARLLPEQVEIALAADAVGVANDACTELEAICARYQSDALAAAAAHARGSVDLAAGEPQAALRALRRAAHLWQELGAPYEAARTRELIGLACQALGDEDSARLQREAARNAYARLGAAPDLARLSAPPHSAHGLTPRELEVLRLLATGKTNKAIADRLVLSERTIDRHVSNLFVKLRVSSRAAATSFAYEHKLV